MDESKFTKRLAIVAIDFDQVSISRIYKIFETILDKKLCSVRKYAKNDRIFAVAEFISAADSFKIYEMCDESVIENTNEQFNLSIIPDDLDLGDFLEESFSGKEYFHKKVSNKSKINYEKMMEVSSEDAAGDSEIDSDQNCINEDKKSINENKKSIIENKGKLSKAIENEGKLNELDGFKAEVISDQRFKKLFINSEFGLDASNYKFKKQKCSKEIVEAKRKAQIGELKK